MYVQRKICLLLSKYCRRGKAVSFTHYECVCLYLSAKLHGVMVPQRESYILCCIYSIFDRLAKCLVSVYSVGCPLEFFARRTRTHVV